MSTNNNYQIEKSQTKLVSQKVRTLPSELTDKFEKIDKKYESEISAWKSKRDSLTLTDENAKSQAVEKLSEYYNTEMGKIENKYSTKESKLKDLDKTLNEKKSAQLEQVKDDYTQDLQDLRYDSIEKGWRESSIYQNEQGQIESDFLRKNSEIDRSINEKLEVLSFEKSMLEREKEQALEKFDIAYAQKINSKISQIQKEFEKANSSERKKVEAQLETLLEDVGREKTREVLSYLNKKSRLERQQFLSDNPNLKDEIGKSWYAILTSWIAKKR